MTPERRKEIEDIVRRPFQVKNRHDKLNDAARDLLAYVKQLEAKVEELGVRLVVVIANRDDLQLKVKELEDGLVAEHQYVADEIPVLLAEVRAKAFEEAAEICRERKEALLLVREPRASDGFHQARAREIGEAKSHLSACEEAIRKAANNG